MTKNCKAAGQGRQAVPSSALCSLKINLAQLGALRAAHQLGPSLLLSKSSRSFARRLRRWRPPARATPPELPGLGDLVQRGGSAQLGSLLPEDLQGFGFGPLQVLP